MPGAKALGTVKAQQPSSLEFPALFIVEVCFVLFWFCFYLFFLICLLVVDFASVQLLQLVSPPWYTWLKVQGVGSEGISSPMQILLYFKDLF